jgi:hypothetical protein
MDQRVINLYDRFTHGGINRRKFLDRLSGIAGSAAAAVLLPFLQGSHAQAQETRIGFAPEDRFMVTLGNTLVVVRRDGLVFGADVVGRKIQPVFQFS